MTVRFGRPNEEVELLGLDIEGGPTIGAGRVVAGGETAVAEDPLSCSLDGRFQLVDGHRVAHDESGFERLDLGSGMGGHWDLSGV